MKKNLFALAIAIGSSFNLDAQAPVEANPLLAGSLDTLVIEEVAPIAGEALSSGDPRSNSAECSALYRAVLIAHVRKGSAIHGRGLWL